MNNPIFIMGYHNPDTDSIVTSYSLAYLYNEIREDEYICAYTGLPQQEARFVMKSFDIEKYFSQLNSFDEVNGMILVDTHYPEQLVDDLPVNKVIQIIDHHPDPSDTVFHYAEIINEPVGAATTLIYELYLKFEVKIPKLIAEIMQCGIISNTLHFTAPATTTRDKIAYEELVKQYPLSEKMVEQMFKNRYNFDNLTTEKILLSDLKRYVINDIIVGISQVEVFESQKIIKLLNEELHLIEKIGESHGYDIYFVSVVSIKKRDTTILWSGEFTRKILEQILQENLQEDQFTKSRIMQRKTDFIPQLYQLLDQSHL